MTELPDIFSFANIYRCYLACRRNKRNTVNALRFEINAEENILKLERELRNRTYSPARSILFAATKPKLREIFAADFRDRVVHHILVDRLERIWEPVFIHDSYACRKGKGTHAAVMRLQSFLQKVSRNGRARAYYLQLDIKDFFTSIDKGILFKALQKKIPDKEALWLTEKTVFWDCTRSFISKDKKGILKNIPPHKSIFGKDNKQGLPIGNLTSQFFANVYLNELDQFVKHVLKARYYLRYVDDFVLLSEDEETLRLWRGEIEAFLAEKLLLRLHPKRRKLLPISNGIDFLGYIIRRDYILVRRRVINNLKARLRGFASRHCEGRSPEAISESEIASSRPKSGGTRNDSREQRTDGRRQMTENHTPSFRKPAGLSGIQSWIPDQVRDDSVEDRGIRHLRHTAWADPSGALWRTGFKILDSDASRNDNRRACIQSYLAHFKWANSYRLTQNLITRIDRFPLSSPGVTEVGKQRTEDGAAFRHSGSPQGYPESSSGPRLPPG